MNLDSVSSVSSGSHSNQRKERISIAAQACDTCRSRKQKCDEKRPKCDRCQQMKLECRYRETQPTKKDKTLVEILVRLESLEGKVDRIPTQGQISSGFIPAQASISSQPSFGPETDTSTSYVANSAWQLQQPSPSGTNRIQPHRYASTALNILTWPAIKQLLLQSHLSNLGDLQSLQADASAFIIRMQKGIPNLTLDEVLPDQPFIGMQPQEARETGGARVTFPVLNYETMHRLATAYFDTFNFLYPFMDRQDFTSETLSIVHTSGFGGDIASVIALLIFALGELAIDGSGGNPIDIYKGRPSGLRGGTLKIPPGLALFNEARKRIGFVLTGCDLENVQIFSLVALYYESCSHHVDSWRLTVSASLACQVLVTYNLIDWDSQRGDLIKRAYWHCVIMETGLHLELGLPLSDIITLQDRVGLPSFNGPFCEADYRGNQSSHFKAHYASQIAIQHLFVKLHNSISDLTNTDTPAAFNEYFGDPTAGALKQLASQLDQWRGMLPHDLQWPEDDSSAFPPSPPPASSAYNQQLDPSLSVPIAHQARLPLFITNLEKEPIHYPYAFDIQVALLRTRYYYAKYIVYRPFVYKALHFPEQMTQEDAEGVADCLRSCIKWPLTLSPTSRHKRLIPYLFCWSQNFLGILLIIHLTKHSPTLLQIRQQLCIEGFETEIDQGVDLMLDWIRDLKDSDPIALWCYNILQGIYGMEP